MIRASVIALFTILILCGFCGKEFKSVGRHSWRCKSKTNYERRTKVNAVPAMEVPIKEYAQKKNTNLSNVAVAKSAKELAGLKCTNAAAELSMTLKTNCNNK